MQKIILRFLLIFTLQVFTQDIEDNEENKFFDFLILNAFDHQDPSCKKVKDDFAEINRSSLGSHKDDYDLTKMLILKICANDPIEINNLDREIRNKLSFTNNFDYMNYFLYLRQALSPHLYKNNLEEIEKIYSKAIEISYAFGKSHNIEVLVLRPLISMIFKFCDQGFFLYCLRASTEIENSLIDLLKIPSVIKRQSSVNAAAYSLKDIRILKIESLMGLGHEYYSSMLAELKKLDDLFFYSAPDKIVYKEFYLEYENYLKRNFPEESKLKVESYEKNLLIDLSQENFFHGSDFLTLSLAYKTLIKYGSFPKNEYERFKNYALLNLRKMKEEDQNAYVLTGLLSIEFEIKDRDSVLGGEICNFMRNNGTDYLSEFNLAFICNSRNIEERWSNYKIYLSKIDKEKIDFSSLAANFVVAPTSQVIQMEEIDQVKNWYGNSVSQELLNLAKYLILYFPHKYKEYQLSRNYYDFIERTLNVIPDKTVVSLNDGSAELLAYIYKAINPTSYGGILANFLNPSKFETLNKKIEQKFIIYPDRILKEIETVKREDIVKYKNSLLQLIRSFFYHANAYGLKIDEENLFDDFWPQYKSDYAYLDKVWCLPSNYFSENGENKNSCYSQKQRDALIFLSRHGSEFLVNLNFKIQDFNNEEKQGLRESSAPELFNRNIYSKEYKDLRHWTLFLMDLYFEYVLHDLSDVKVSRAFSDNKNKSDERLTSLFIQNFSLESYSRIQNAYQKNKVLKKYQGTDYARKIKDYDKALDDFLRFKESLVNFRPTYQGGKNFNASESMVLSLASEARKKFNEVYFHRNEKNENMFKNEDFSVGDINPEILQNLLEDDEILSIFSYIEDGPGIRLFLSNKSSYFSFDEKKEISDSSIEDLIDSLSVKNLKKEIDYDELNSFYTKYLGGINVVSQSFDGRFDEAIAFLNPEDSINFKKVKRKKVYIVSDNNNLQKIPFSALYNKRQNLWAFEKYDFVYLDSLGSFVLSKEQEKIKLTKNLSFAAFANPDFKGSEKDTDFKNLFSKSRGSDNKELLENLSKLPETEEEVLEISKNFIKSNIFVGQNATEDNLKKFLGNASNNAQILSFATHAFSDITNYTREHGLAFSPPLSSDSLNDGFLTSQEIRKLNLNDSIIILSACDTDKPLMITQDSYSGFIRSFIEAGAKTILYTSWDIDSKSAQVFMTETFKAGVASNLQISEAVSSTMKKFERGDFGEKYRHPFYWAPYKVFGID
jgi:CHAT domain-containing protein